MAYEESFAFKLLQKFESLRERVEHYIAVVNLCPLPAFITSKEGTEILYVNPAYRRLLGVVEEDLQNLDWLRVIHPDDREMVKSIWQNYIATKQDGVTFTSRHRYINNNTGMSFHAVTHTTSVVNNGIVGYIIPNDCSILLLLGVDLQCEVQKAKMAAGVGYDPTSS